MRMRPQDAYLATWVNLARQDHTAAGAQWLSGLCCCRCAPRSLAYPPILFLGGTPVYAALQDISKCSRYWRICDTMHSHFHDLRVRPVTDA